MDWTAIFIRLALAVAVGFAIGVEREHHHRPAGIKTHIMVCMGAAIVSMTQLLINDDVLLQAGASPELAGILRSDPGRLAAQVISGIGFLGAGTILQKKGAIKGLTTAATLWLTACVGIAVGMGYYTLVLLALGVTLVILIGLRLMQKLILRRYHLTFEVEFTAKKEAMTAIAEIFSQRDIKIKSVDVSAEGEDAEAPLYRAYYTVNIPPKGDAAELFSAILAEDTVTHLSEVTE